MATSTPDNDPKPDDIALEQATPEQVEQLEKQAEAEGAEAPDAG